MTDLEKTILDDKETIGNPPPDLMTEEELIDYLRIREISNAMNLHNVIENLKRMRDLPRIHICGKPLYPLKAIREWVERNTGTK